MKKILFVSGALVCAASGANAANIINGNPMYSPAKGRFYNVFTPLGVNTEFDKFIMADEFGYGITDNLTVMLQTAGSYDSSNNPQFGKWAWNYLQAGLDWTVFNQGEYQSEIYGRVMQVYDTRQHLETVAYNWTVGAQMGRVTDDWVLAGVVELDYLKDDLPHYSRDAWAMTVGLQGQYLIDSAWNFVANIMFDFDLFDDYYDGERLRIELGVNYNIDSTKYLGMLMSKDVVHNFDVAPMTFKIQFGVDF